MRMGRRQRTDLSPGEDSFLDIIANLVGILIILVVVVGAHAGSKIRQAAIQEVDRAELDAIEEKYDSLAKHSISLEKDNHSLERQIEVEQHLVQDREMARQGLLIEIEDVRREIERRKANLTTEHQQAVSNRQDLEKLRFQFSEMQRSVSAMENVVTKRETIEHHPTPIAKTVFSDELHFRVQNGRIVHVPMTQLVDSMRDEWQEKAKKLQTARETIETVGPIGDFRLQYRLQSAKRSIRTSYGEIVRETPEFTRFVLVPKSENIGIPVEKALSDGSQFRTWIDGLEPQKTTVSLWVYPESFEEFNRLKRWLYERGFQTACWPLSRNGLISGGPSGFRSTAQ